MYHYADDARSIYCICLTTDGWMGDGCSWLEASMEEGRLLLYSNVPIDNKEPQKGALKKSFMYQILIYCKKNLTIY